MLRLSRSTRWLSLHLAGALLGAAAVQAQKVDPINGMQGVLNIANVQLAGTDPYVAVGLLIRTLLTFLGVLFFLLVLYAGFNWMTAAGNTEKVEQAKTTIGQATLGIGVILIAYLLSYAIIYVLQVSIAQP